MDTSPTDGTGRGSLQMKLGWVAFALLVIGIAASFKMLPVGFGFVGVGAVLLLVALVLELRTRKAFEAADGSAFREGGTFGGRRSPQTHTRM